MSLTIEQDGKEIVVFTAEEMAEKDAKIDHLTKVSSEKTENFRRYNEMTEEERQAHSENELNLIRRGDTLEEELKNVKETLAQKEAREREEMRTNTMKRFHGGIADVQATLEAKYALLAGMPEETADQVQARTMEAARLAGISIDSRNPLYQSVNGEAPVYKENKEFVETPEGKEAADLARAALQAN